MNTILQEELIKKTLPNIIKSLCIYAINNKSQKNIEDLLVGELFTLIRRHLPHLCSTTYNFSKYNIDRIYINYDTGELLYINFSVNYRFRGCYKPELIECLNNIIEEIDPNYSNLNFSAQLNNITRKIENYNLISI
jgi:hypothetical protein